MAQVTIRKIVEGDAHLVLRVDMVSDGSTGELVNYPILSPSDLNPARANNRPAFRIMQMWYGCVWFDIDLDAAGVTNANMWTIARDCDSHIDFRSFGGIIDPGVYVVPPPDDYGILLMSTNGFTPAGSKGTLVLELRKTN